MGAAAGRLQVQRDYCSLGSRRGLSGGRGPPDPAPHLLPPWTVSERAQQEQFDSTDERTSEEWIDERIPVEPGGTLYIDLDRGTVEVRSHDASEVYVQAEARGWASGMVRFTLSKHGDEVEFDGSIDGWFPNLLGPRIEVRAWVPREFSVEIETRGGRIYAEEIRGRVGAVTSGGRIEIARIAGPVLARTSGGRVEILDVLGDVRARTSGSSVRVAGARGSVEARTSGGSIKVEDAGDEVDGRTSGGSVSASFVDEPWGRLETSGGSISVECSGDAGIDLDAKTSGGTIKIDRAFRTDGKGNKSRFRGQINGGGSPLGLRTSGGSIRIRAR